jgi:1-acyl-sn-glycerol-3-phosphate acyltransferase
MTGTEARSGKMMRVVGSLAFWGFIFFSSLLLFPLAALLWVFTVPFDSRRFAMHRFTSLWASLYTWLNPAWRVTIEGRERLLNDSPSVLVANHLSLVDILVLFRMQSHFKWVSKLENFQVPVIGWNMKLCGYIPLRRGDGASIRAMMRQCDKALAGGSSIVMFPEGTRSPTGRMRRFMPGAFQIAIRNGVPIQPVVIRGTSDALPKEGFILQGRHPISIKILEPIPPKSFEGEEADVLMARVRQIFVDELKEPTPVD